MPTVLVAEADRELRGAYAQFLSVQGFRVESAADGLECLSKLCRGVPELLLLDWELPWGGGAGVLAILREKPRFCPKRVVLLSAAQLAPTLGEWVRSPIVRVVYKPFPLSALLEEGETTRT